MRKKSFWDSRATIHITLTEKELYMLDILAREKNKTKSQILSEIINSYEEIKKLKKSFKF